MLMKSKRPKPLVFTDLGGEEPSAALAQRPAESPAEAAPVPAAPAAAAVPEPVPAPAQPLPATSKTLKPVRSNELGFARHAYLVAFLASLVWAGGLAAFVAGFQTRFGAFDYTPLQWAVIGFLAVLPAAFIVLAAYMIREAARLAAETRRARALAEDLAIPAALAVDQTGGALEAMRKEIERAAEAARAARGPILSLRETLSSESRRLSQAAREAETTGQRLAETLGKERSALGELSSALQLQASDAAEALARQARIIADASDLAQAQLDEAQAALAARAAGLAVAAGDARQAADAASDQLTRQIDRLETTGVSLGDRAEAVSERLGRERAQLASLADSLRADQEGLSARLEAHRTQLSDAADDARQGAAALIAASSDGAEALRSLIAVAAEEVRRLTENAHQEHEALGVQAREALGLFSGAVAEERAAIEARSRTALAELAGAADEARRAAAGHADAAAQAAEAHVESARTGLERLAADVGERIDSLGETAFAAGQHADQVFESRMATARRMIDQSTALVREAGEQSVQRIEAGLAGARTAVTDMQALLAEIDSRMERLPENARAQTAAVRQAVEDGVGDLAEAARRTAAETQAIDAAFQERVRRNYEILSDAVRLMGRVAAGPADPARPAASVAPASISPPIKPAAPVIKPAAGRPEPASEPREPAREPELRAAVGGERAFRAPLEPTSVSSRPVALADPYPAAPPARHVTPSAATAGLRPRLRLTPADEPQAEPEPAAPQAERPAEVRAEPQPQAADEWTWKDLLSSMDQPAGDDDDDALADRLIGEIEALGVDTAALLPQPRIDEIAAALQTGDAGGAREVVRRLAPAAVRRLSRRVLTDRLLRAEADRYVRRYEALLDDAARRDREGYMTAALLGSEPGRAFLLLDAAVGDLH